MIFLPALPMALPLAIILVPAARFLSTSSSELPIQSALLVASVEVVAELELEEEDEEEELLLLELLESPVPPDSGAKRKTFTSLSGYCFGL